MFGMYSSTKPFQGQQSCDFHQKELGCCWKHVLHIHLVTSVITQNVYIYILNVNTFLFCMYFILLQFSGYGRLSTIWKSQTGSRNLSVGMATAEAAFQNLELQTRQFTQFCIWCQNERKIIVFICVLLIH